MPWQRHVVDVALEVDENGVLVYREVVLVVPRQSGKSTLVLAIAVHRALAWARAQSIAYTAQTRNDARLKWEDDHVAALDASPIGKRRPKPYRVRKANGSEAILWKNGSRHGITASTERAGHGSTLDLGFIDEAFAQPDARLEQAFKPAMITRTDPQLWIVSTAGRTSGASPYLWSKVEGGRARCDAGHHQGVAYFEWSAADDMPRDDPATWWATMPALGHTITEAAVAADFASMDAAEFDRAYLNRWAGIGATQAIPGEPWARCAMEAFDLANPVSFAIDTTPDRSMTSIVAASRLLADPDLVGIEVIVHRKGTGWVVDRAKRLFDDHHARHVVIDPRSAAAGFIEPLQAAGVTVEVVTTAEAQQAAAGLYDDVIDGKLRHLSQAPLEAAIVGSAKREFSEGAFLWNRRAGADISPLVGATLARWGALQPEPELVDLTMNVW